MVKQIGSAARDGFRLGGHADSQYRGNIGFSLAGGAGGPVDFVLLLEFFGLYGGIAVVAYGATIALYPWTADAPHAFARSAIALAGALLFATAAILILIPAWNETPRAAPARSSSAA